MNKYELIQRYFYLVVDEIIRADVKFSGVENDVGSWFLKISEEFGEVARELIEGRYENAEKETIQLIGLCFNFLVELNKYKEEI